jgi:hypothetical protein
MPTCPRCNKELAPDIERCPLCGAELPRRGLLDRLFGGSRPARPEPAPVAAPTPAAAPEPPRSRGPVVYGERVMKVEDVFSITGRGTVVTGRAEASIRVGDALSFESAGTARTTTVTGIEMFRKLLDEAKAGDSVGLLLKGVSKTDVVRGIVLTRAR